MRSSVWTEIQARGYVAHVEKPHVTFFVELPSEDLNELFRDGGVADFLVRGGHSVSMGLLDLTPQRAAVVRKLEERGVAVTGWLLLDVADGYWLNADNAEQAGARYRQTAEWAAREGLRLRRIGLDIEFPRADGDLIMRERGRGLWQLFRRRRTAAEVRQAEAAYAGLVEDIHRGGRTVETYHFPQLLDERTAGSMLLRRTLGIADVPADAEVYMLYASYLGRAMAQLYFDEAPCIALGVTGGGVHAGDPHEEQRLLSADELHDELRCAARGCRNLYVFSLEGCVRRDLLPGIERLDWSASNDPIPDTAIRRASRRRVLLRAVLRSERLLDLCLPSQRRRP